MTYELPRHMSQPVYRLGGRIQYESRLSARMLQHGQPDSCFICAVPFSGTKPNLDHDHDSGVVRGWLCTRCNQGLGYFLDDPMLLIRAANYLVPDEAEFIHTERVARASVGNAA